MSNETTPIGLTPIEWAKPEEARPLENIQAAVQTSQASCGYGEPCLTPAEEAIVSDSMRRYRLSREQALLSLDRRRVYGDPEVNHRGIAQSIAGILQPWAGQIAKMEPLPIHVIALIMAATKLNRQRMIYHKDNFDDMRVYQGFAQAWQEEYFSNPLNPEPQVLGPCPGPDYEIQVSWVHVSDLDEVKR